MEFATDCFQTAGKYHVQKGLDEYMEEEERSAGPARQNESWDQAADTQPSLGYDGREKAFPDTIQYHVEFVCNPWNLKGCWSEGRPGGKQTEVCFFFFHLKALFDLDSYHKLLNLSMSSFLPLFHWASHRMTQPTNESYFRTISLELLKLPSRKSGKPATHGNVLYKHSKGCCTK